jgi:predicted CXXCH cytochrome family protein
MATTNPNHIEFGLPEYCAQCHSIASFTWTDAGFDHSFFALEQGHSSINCSECHTTGKYSDANPDCYSCHEQDYIASKEPDHVASVFSKVCTDCHTTNPGWKPTTFDHSSFPLTLGHSTPTCNDCHKGNYTSAPTDCYVCHQADYDGSINPNHQSLGFSTACITCHNTNPDWKPAKYLEHDSQFPIYSGKHQGQWNACTDCHTNLSNYSSFSCIICHEHNQAEMDDKHLGQVSGYSYNSSECYRCHPRGSAD